MNYCLTNSQLDITSDCVWVIVSERLNFATCINSTNCLSCFPFEDCETKTTKENNTKNTKDNDPNPVVILGIWCWGCRERIWSKRKSLRTDVGIVNGILIYIKGYWLTCSSRWRLKIVSKHSEEFLEEHTTKDNVWGLIVDSVQVRNLKLALLKTSRNLNVLSKSSKWDANVTSYAISEINLEVPVIEFQVTIACIWH
jgi:hypothetical protein